MASTKPEIDRIIEYLKKHLSPARFNHTIGTWRTARDLAVRYNLPMDKIDLAALLHDLGKGYSKQELVKYVKKHKVRVPCLKDIIRYNPWLLHSFVGADVARKRFHVKDKDILEAIAFHTIAKSNMSALAKVIYMADITAPDRRFPKVKLLRWHARRNLDKAMQIAFVSKLWHVIHNKKWMHPVAIDAWNSVVKKY